MAEHSILACAPSGVALRCLGKACARELRQAAGYKPAVRTGRRPVFLACAAAKPAQTRRYLAIPELFARLRHCKSLFPRDAETSTQDARATLTGSR